MGQPISVSERPSAHHGLVRFELDRSLTGMGHVRLERPPGTSAVEASSSLVGDSPVHELGRRLFATGKVKRIHLYSNIVTVELEAGCQSDGLASVIEDLYLHWVPGVEPPVFEDETPAEA